MFHTKRINIYANYYSNLSDGDRRFMIMIRRFARMAVKVMVKTWFPKNRMMMMTMILTRMRTGTWSPR